jgi:predicted nucleotidyltransferase
MTDDKIEKFIKEIAALFKLNYSDFAGVYFYGSRVRGDYKADSDYDLIFVFERNINWKFKEEIRHLIYEYEDRYDLFVDSKILSAGEMDMNRMPLIQNVKDTGIFYGI